MDSVKKVCMKRYKAGFIEETDDSIVIEMPLNIFINNKYYATLMCTPSELKELCTGFLFTEGLLESKNDIKAMEYGSQDIMFISLEKEIESVEMYGRTIVSGCGGGIAGSNIIKQNKLTAVNSTAVFNSSDILKFMSDFNTMSRLFQKTGGVHSCCVCSKEGIEFHSEDIGRHNAIDKTIGKCMLNDVDIRLKMMFTTGRISSDSVLKAAKAGVPVVVSHSAPTNLAVEMAKTLDMTLIGFARGNRMNIYWGDQRIIFGH